MTASLRVKGDKELIQALNTLPKRPYRNAVRAGLRKAGTVMNKAVKNAVPSSVEVTVTTKHRGDVVYDIAKDLKQSIGQKSKSYAKDDTFIRVVGPRFGFVGKSTGLRPSPFAHGIEYGTMSTTPRPFMRPAFDSAKGPTLRRFASALREEIDRQAKKLRGAS